MRRKEKKNKGRQRAAEAVFIVRRLAVKSERKYGRLWVHNRLPDTVKITKIQYIVFCTLLISHLIQLLDHLMSTFRLLVTQLGLQSRKRRMEGPGPPRQDEEPCVTSIARVGKRPLTCLASAETRPQ
jgi:hypothetical protein